MKTMNSISDKIDDVWGAVIEHKKFKYTIQYLSEKTDLKIYNYKEMNFQNIGMVGGKEVFLERVRIRK